MEIGNLQFKPSKIANAIFNSANDPTQLEYVELIKNGVIRDAIEIPGFTKAEMLQFRMRLTNDIYLSLNPDNFLFYIKLILDMVTFISDSLFLDLKTKSYETESMRQDDKNQYILECRFKEYLGKLVAHYELKKKNQTSSRSATHREACIAHHFLVEAGEEKYKNRTDWINERGPKGYQAFLSTVPGPKQKPYRLDELEFVVELLVNHPTAQKLAINKLDQLQNS